MKILIVDNFDSFTYNIKHYINNYADVDVIRVDNKDLITKITKYDKIVLSPGPGLPKDRVELNKIIELSIKYNKALLGICLGHQAIAEYFGAKLFNMNEVNHGIEKNTIIVKNDTIFCNLPKQFMSGRYHSWAVDDKTITNDLFITSIDNEGVIMSLSHNAYNIKGLQFHPESILTQYGKVIVENWVKN